ncbi:MAG: endolytic transglycosylase MltG [Pseudomonadales bacterium]|nr:endolytic transglycosylase MltG [Pseudomonadales bacterium]
MIRGVAAAVVLLGIAVVVVLVADAELDRPIEVAGEDRIFQIERGASLNAVVSRLARENIIDTHPIIVRIWAMITASRGSIQAGEYRLLPDMTTTDVFVLFRSGKVVQHQITFVEGWTFDQWRTHFQAHEALQHTLDEVSDAGIMKMLGEADLSPEGQFFPDTYHFTRGESDISVLQRAHKRMKQVLDDEWRQRAVGSVLNSPYEALILASIVEKETGYEPDRKKIARVFINRLERNIKLQSDPTVIYALGDDFDGDLKRSHLKLDSPYNTYSYRGLPPTPISNPGLASLQATMQPSPGDWLYFVGRGDGTSHFSSTLEEHNDAVTRFHKTGRVENYRSVPEVTDD